MTLPANITLTQAGLTPTLTLADGAITPPPPGLPPYPVNPDPAKTYTLTLVAGQLVWVATSIVPLSISAPQTGVAGQPLAVTGTVFPPSDSVVFGLSATPIDQPGNGLVAAENIAGALSGSLTPIVPGNCWAWALDTATGATAVSGVIIVSAAPAAS